MTLEIEPRNAYVPVVELHEGKPITTSQDVAAFFGKAHRNVLRQIRELIERLSPELRLIFEQQLEDVPGPNGSMRSQPSYRMTRDGFTLLAMGFTGERALEFKLAYIDAFNRMEEQLRRTPAESDAIRRFEETFHRGRFLARLHEDGSLTLKPIADTCAVFDPTDAESAAVVMREMVPASMVPGMIQAGVERLARVNKRIG